MALIEKIGLLAIVKVIKIVAKHSYDELSKNSYFFSLLKEYGIEYPKDNFTSLYMHTCLLYASKGNHKELIELFLLYESKEAFKEEVSNGKIGAFKRSLNHSLHTNKLVKELKSLDNFPSKDIEEFNCEYKLLLKKVASPVHTETFNKLDDISNNISIGFNDQNRKMDQLQEGMSLILARSDDLSKLQDEYERQINDINKKIEIGLVKESISQLSNLKKAIWSNANDRIKFRILTNLGVAYYKEDNNKEASKYLIEAYKYNANSEIALSNIINAYLAENDLINANKYLADFFSEFPNSVKAYSSLIRLQNNITALNKIKNEIPKLLRDNYEILLSFGIINQKLGYFDKSIRYIRKAIKKNPDDASLKEYLLNSILDKYSANFQVLNLRNIDKKAKDDLDEAISLIEELLIIYNNSDLLKRKAQLLMNKSIVLNLLNQYENSIIAIDDALKVHRNDPTLLKQRALLLAYNGKEDESRKTIEQIKNLEMVPDLLCLLAELYRNDGNPEYGIEILENTKEMVFENEVDNHIKSVLLRLYIETRQEVKIEEIGSTEFQSDSVLDIINRSKIDKYFSREKEATESLLKAKQNIDRFTSHREKYLLAEELLGYNKISEAIDIFISIANLDIDNELTNKIGKLYYSIGEKGKCLKILQNLREQNGVTPNTPIEISIYQEYNDYNNAIIIAEEYLVHYPNDILMKIRVAGINLRLDKYKSVDSFLLEDIEIGKLSKDELNSYLGLLIARNFREKLFKLIYEFRRVNNNSTGHTLYWSILLQFPMTEIEIISPSMAIQDTVVTLKNENNDSFSLIIEDRLTDQLLENEINVESEKYKLLKNKKVGDTVIFKSSSAVWTITSIANKMVYAFHESQKKCETIYSEKSPFFSFHMDDLPEVLERFSKAHQETKNSIDAILSYYKDKKIPLGAIAENLNKNPIFLWLEYSKSSQIGIQSSFGNIIELEEAIKDLDKSKTICIDITGLLTAFELDIGDLIVGNFQKLLISASTYDLILNFKYEVNLFTTPDQKSRENKLDLFIEFVKRITQQTVPTNVFDINSEEKQRLNSLLGRSFIDTALLANDTNSILLSDDVIFRKIIKGEYSVNGVWSQVLLRYFLENNKIDNETYQKKVIQLMQLNYLHTTVDRDTLLLAAKLSNYNYEEPLITCLYYLNGKISSKESSIVVGFGFLYWLWSDINIDIKKKSSLTIWVISALCTNRIIINVLDRLDYLAAMQTRPNFYERNEWICSNIWKHIKKWKRMRDISEINFGNKILSLYK